MDAESWEDWVDDKIREVRGVLSHHFDASRRAGSLDTCVKQHVRLLGWEYPEGECYDKQHFFSSHSLHLLNKSVPTVNGPTSGIVRRALVGALREAKQLGLSARSDHWLRITLDERNPSIRGFLVEQIIISCIQVKGLQVKDLDVKAPGDEEPTEFTDIPKYDNIKKEITQHVPKRFNFKHIDSVIVEKLLVNWRIYVVQVTLSSPSDHKSTLEFFDQKNLEKWSPTQGKVEWHLVWVTRKEHASKQYPVVKGFKQHYVCFEELKPGLHALKEH